MSHAVGAPKPGSGVGGHHGHQAELQGQFHHAPINACVVSKAPCMRDHHTGEEMQSRAVRYLFSLLLQPPA